MSQVTLSEKGIGPFQYRGYNYWVAPASTRVLRRWGLRGTDTGLPNLPYVNSSTPVDDHNLGDYNTNVLTSSTYSSINDGNGSIGAPAATYTRELGPEWYLPNSRELHHVIYQNRSAIDAADTTIGGSTSPSLANIGASTARDGSNTRSTPQVWSSTERSSTSAFSQRLSDGSISSSKVNETWVVAVRRA